MFFSAVWSEIGYGLCTLVLNWVCFLEKLATSSSFGDKTISLLMFTPTLIYVLSIHVVLIQVVSILSMFYQSSPVHILSYSFSKKWLLCLLFCFCWSGLLKSFFTSGYCRLIRRLRQQRGLTAPFHLGVPEKFEIKRLGNAISSIETTGPRPR